MRPVSARGGQAVAGCGARRLSVDSAEAAVQAAAFAKAEAEAKAKAEAKPEATTEPEPEAMAEPQGGEVELIQRGTAWHDAALENYRKRRRLGQ